MPTHGTITAVTRRIHGNKGKATVEEISVGTNADGDIITARILAYNALTHWCNHKQVGKISRYFQELGKDFNHELQASTPAKAYNKYKENVWKRFKRRASVWQPCSTAATSKTSTTTINDTSNDQANLTANEQANVTSDTSTTLPILGLDTSTAPAKISRTDKEVLDDFLEEEGRPVNLGEAARVGEAEGRQAHNGVVVPATVVIAC